MAVPVKLAQSLRFNLQRVSDELIFNNTGHIEPYDRAETSSKRHGKLAERV